MTESNLLTDLFSILYKYTLHNLLIHYTVLSVKHFPNNVEFIIYHYIHLHCFKALLFFSEHKNKSPPFTLFFFAQYLS